MHLFAYGTLMDGDVRRLVLGQGDAGAPTPASLPGYTRRAVVGEVYPGLLADPGAVTEGLLVPLSDALARDRLAFFEGPRQPPQPLPVRCELRGVVTALVCLSAPDLPLAEAGWDLSNWQTRHKAAYLAAATRWMAAFPEGDITAALAEWERVGRGRGI